MSKLSYSQAVRSSLKELEEREKGREKEREKEREKKERERKKELYSKGCVAQCINFVVGKASKEVTNLDNYEQFSRNLATILARDKEVVAVWLRILQDRCEIYLSKNFGWLDKDNKYIENITNYLKNISKFAPAISKDDEKGFLAAVAYYCYTKLKFRLDKLKDTIKFYGDNEHVKSFKDFFSAKVGHTNNTDTITISGVCSEFYEKVKNDPEAPKKFLEHLKKVGSYMVSVIGILKCARNIQYKSLFANVRIIKVDPVIISKQPIYSWKNIIKRFIDEDKYNDFMDRCSKNPEVMKRISEVYTDNATKQQQQLDGDDVNQCIYLHAETGILALIIQKKINSRVFIAVSKSCCYLCGLFIDFVKKQGYNIAVYGKHMKIYCRWIFPYIENNDFKARSLEYLLENLDRIIDQNLNHPTKSLPADPDSPGNSPDPYNNDVLTYPDTPKFNKYTLL
ncbi:hypothetical protein C1646_781687 [Rhizophagus diaphanus]|nr:hypothetical protein C1646_781687 [Rhizophagus diaphanus] [Rhizophagus sp. MUCL 43196]